MAAGEFRWGNGPLLEATFDSVQAADLFAAFVRNETWQVPTLVVLRQIASTVDGAATGALGMAYMPEEWRTIWEAPLGRFASDVKSLLPFSKELVGRMHRAGVPIQAGTDFPNPYTFPGFSLHDELELLVEAGLPPLAALRAATISPARFFNVTAALSSITVGNVADMVLLDGNPGEEIGMTRSIRSEIQGGRVMDRATLDAMLDQARKLAEQAPPSGIW